MANNVEEKVTNINEATENKEPEVNGENTNLQETKKTGLIEKFKELKWWQKALILAGGATLVFVGGKWVFKTVGKKPEVAVEAAKVVGTIEPEEVVNVIAENSEAVAG